MTHKRITMAIAAVAIGAVTLHLQPANAKQPNKVRNEVQAIDGKEVYLKSCKECHGVLGAPTKAALRKYSKIPNFTDPAFFKSRAHPQLLESVERGKGRDMKGFSEKLSKGEIDAVVQYIHTLEKK